MSDKRKKARKTAAEILKGGADDTAPDRERLALVVLAQDVDRDERHWSVVDVADRAENAKELAGVVLKFFGMETPPCLKNCKDCEDHRKNTGRERMAYNEIVLEHFFNPRNCFRMEKPNVVGKAGEPGRGPFMLLYLRVDGERIREASFQSYGCGPTIAAGSVLTEKLGGSSREESATWTEQAINEALGGLPAQKRHCSALAASALKSAIEAWRKGS